MKYNNNNQHMIENFVLPFNLCGTGDTIFYIRSSFLIKIIMLLSFAIPNKNYVIDMLSRLSFFNITFSSWNINIELKINLLMRHQGLTLTISYLELKILRFEWIWDEYIDFLDFYMIYIYMKQRNFLFLGTFSIINGFLYQGK